jgi:hypothetical protein
VACRSPDLQPRYASLASSERSEKQRLQLGEWYMVPPGSDLCLGGGLAVAYYGGPAEPVQGGHRIDLAS